MTIIYIKVEILIDLCDLLPHVFVLYFVYIIFLQYNVYISNPDLISNNLSINMTI